MPPRLTRADVERIAALAHLDLTDDEADLFTEQLAQILEYAEQLRQVDTSDVPAAWRPGAGSAALRDDAPQPSLARDDALAGAPDQAPGGLFRVPKVIG